MSRPLPTAAHLVLGLVEQLGEATPYDLKAVAANSTNFLFQLPHTQIYTQCEKLVAQGLLDETRETGGRRRRVLSITDDGARVLQAWRDDPTVVPVEARDLALLKIFLGADPSVIGPDQVLAHRAQLTRYREMAAGAPDMAEGIRAALVFGMRYEEALVEFWSSLVARSSRPPS